MTLRRLGFTEKTRTPSIKYYCKRIFQLCFAPHTAVTPYLRGVFTLYCTTTSCVSPNKMMFSNFCVSGSLNLFVTLPTLTLESNQIWYFQGQGHVIWLLGMPISEFGTRFCKVELSHQHNKLLFLLWLT